MEEKKSPPVTLSLSVFPDVKIEVAPTSELELEVFPSEEVQRKGGKALGAVASLAADKPLRKAVGNYVLPVVGLGVTAAVRALRKATPKPAAPKKGTGEATYAKLVGAFVRYRKKRKKTLIKQGYDRETGLIHPKPCEKLPKLSKPQKLKRLHKLPKAQKLQKVTKAAKATKLKRLKPST